MFVSDWKETTCHQKVCMPHGLWDYDRNEH